MELKEKRPLVFGIDYKVLKMLVFGYSAKMIAETRVLGYIVTKEKGDAEHIKAISKPGVIINKPKCELEPQKKEQTDIGIGIQEQLRLHKEGQQEQKMARQKLQAKLIKLKEQKTQGQELQEMQELEELEEQEQLHEVTVCCDLLCTLCSATIGYQIKSKGE